MTETLTYRPVEASDVADVFAIETASFPADEAASLESLTYRQKNAPQLFLGAFSPAPSNELLAFICSTATASSTLTHDSMSVHDPKGSYVAIHSVCVKPTHRRKGLASALLKEYVGRMRKEEGVKGLRLIAHDNLIGLYESCGFVNQGESEVVHGSEKWFALSLDFEEGKVEEAPTAREPPAIRNPGYSYSSFEKKGEGNWKKELVGEGDGMNQKAIYCPREDCRSLIMRKNTGKFVQGHKDDISMPPLPQLISSQTSSSSTAPSTSSKSYWSLPSPLAFENIGFTRNVPSSTPNSTASGNIKYLTCADCDFGPLGWHDTEGRDLGLEVELENEGASGEKGEVRKGREFLIDVERVRYL